MRLSAWIVLALTMAFAVVAHAQDKVDLKLTLKQGQSFKIALDTSNASSTTVAGRPIQTTESLKLGLALSVIEARSNGTYKLKAVFEKPSYSLSGTGQGALDMMASTLNKAFAALDGQSFEFELDRAGIVLTITGLDAAVQAATSATDSCPEPAKSFVSACFGQMVGEASWRQTLSGLFTLLPDAPVAVGERWSRRLSVSSQGLVAQTDAFFKITEHANGVAKVKVFHDIKSVDRSLAIGVRYRLSGTAEGTVEIDESTGLILRGSLKSNLKGSASAQGSTGKSVPLTMTGTVNVSRQ